MATADSARRRGRRGAGQHRPQRQHRRGGFGVIAAATIACVLGACGAPPAAPPPVVTDALVRTHLTQLWAVTGGWGAAPVSLTFDDGPDPASTPQILDILDRYGVKATFFVVGQQVARHPGLAREIVARGHAIANHTWSHANLAGLSDAQIVSQVHRTSDAVVAATGRRPTCVRPPYGAANSRVVSRVASTAHLTVTWTVDPFDWKRPGAPAIVTRVMSGVRPGGIVLLHDGGGNRSQTIAALPWVIEGLQQRGFDIVPTCMPFDLTPPAVG